MDIGYSEFRQNLKQTLDEVTEKNEVVRIKRQNGGDAYLLSEEKYQEFMELQHTVRLFKYFEEFERMKEKNS